MACEAFKIDHPMAQRWWFHELGQWCKSKLISNHKHRVSNVILLVLALHRACVFLVKVEVDKSLTVSVEQSIFVLLRPIHRSDTLKVINPVFDLPLPVGSDAN